MDWAEELKMSIRKTTARKGRRSKSRDVLKAPEQSSIPVVQTSNKPVLSPKASKEISIDITVDLPQTASSSTSHGGLGGLADATDARRPPVRRISGGWADTSNSKGLKSKKGSFDDDYFQPAAPNSISSANDDIPVIPDLDDMKDELLLNEIAEPPSVTVNRVVTLKELNSDILAQNAFSAIEDADLSVLTHCLQSQDSLDEPDDVWEWNKLFTDVMAEIHSDETISDRLGSAGQRKDIGPDEVPPMMCP